MEGFGFEGGKTHLLPRPGQRGGRDAAEEFSDEARVFGGKFGDKGSSDIVKTQGGEVFYGRDRGKGAVSSATDRAGTTRGGKGLSEISGEDLREAGALVGKIEDLMNPRHFGTLFSGEEFIEAFG